MDMTIQEEIEQLVLRCIASDGLKACPKDLAFLERYGLKNCTSFPWNMEWREWTRRNWTAGRED